MLFAAKIFTSIGCSIVACKNRVSSAINYNIKAKMDASIHAAKLKVLEFFFTIFDAGSISASNTDVLVRTFSRSYSDTS